MDAQKHWEHIYETKAPDQVSWFSPHLDVSLELIARVCGSRDAAILDVGGGESTLADDLLALGYSDITVLDIAQTAIDVSRMRLGEAAEQVRWLAADITTAKLEPSRFDLWHDRAVFHFLIDPSSRAAYLRQINRAVKPGGHVIVSTFGPEGPTRCSGLDVVRYDAESCKTNSAFAFQHGGELHAIAPHSFGTLQQFLYCCWKFA